MGFEKIKNIKFIYINLISLFFRNSHTAIRYPGMPFWKKDKDSGEKDKPKEKVNYKKRLEHKQYLVRNFTTYITFGVLYKGLPTPGSYSKALCVMYLKKWRKKSSKPTFFAFYKSPQFNSGFLFRSLFLLAI